MQIAHFHHTSHQALHCAYFAAAGMEGAGLYSACAWALLALTVIGWVLPRKKEAHT